MYDRGVVTGTREDLLARLASLLTATQESCNSADMKLSLIGALSANFPLTSVGLIWRLQCVQLLNQTRSLGMAIDVLIELLDDVESLSK